MKTATIHAGRNRVSSIHDQSGRQHRVRRRAGGGEILVAGASPPTTAAQPSQLQDDGHLRQRPGGRMVNGHDFEHHRRRGGGLAIVRDRHRHVVVEQRHARPPSGKLHDQRDTLIVAAGGSVYRPAGTPGHVVGNLQSQWFRRAVDQVFEVGRVRTSRPSASPSPARAGCFNVDDLTAASTAAWPPGHLRHRPDAAHQPPLDADEGRRPGPSPYITFAFVPATSSACKPEVFVVKRISAGAWSSTTATRPRRPATRSPR